MWHFTFKVSIGPTIIFREQRYFNYCNALLQGTLRCSTLTILHFFIACHHLPSCTPNSMAMDTHDGAWPHPRAAYPFSVFIYFSVVLILAISFLTWSFQLGLPHASLSIMFSNIWLDSTLLMMRPVHHFILLLASDTV